MKNDGKEAERAFVEYWGRVGHIERLRDKRDLVGLNGGRNIADFKKPSDFLVSSPAIVLHFAEVKSTTSKTSFPFGNIEDGQHVAAMKSASRGDRGYMFYIFAYATSTWYMMPCWQYAEIYNSGRRSVKFEELEPWMK